MVDMTILRNDFSKIILLCILAIILFFPFLNKAVSSDSIFYIYTARQIIKEPLKPFSFQLNCAEKDCLAWDVANNPPLVSYFLAAVIKLFGENEKVFHIIFFCFTILCIIGIYYVSKEFKADPFFSALLLIASPAFFVNATDIMLDIPLLTFSVWGLYFIIKEKFFGWIILGFAILIKYIAILNLPVVFMWLLLNKKTKENLKYFLIPITFLFLLMAHNLLIYNEIQILKKSLQVGLSFGLVKEIPLLTYIGGCFIFPLSILWLGFNKKNYYIWIFIISFSAVNLLFNLLELKIIQSFLFGIFISSAICLGMIFINYLKETDFNKDIVFLFIWILLYLVFFASVSAIIAVRYLLPLIIPVIILFVKISENILYKKVFLTFSIVIGIVFSLFISHSDYVLANSYRDISKYIFKNYGKENVYFTGHLGFQYYMENNNFKAIDSKDSKYPENSVIVVPVLPVPQKIHENIVKDLIFKEQKYIYTKNRFRTMDPNSHAGFHLNMYGLLPYSFSNMPLEKFTIYKITLLKKSNSVTPIQRSPTEN
ncbi:MAG TPA: hypothetical protein DCP53_09435 [Elusimicrobia bacterium]|nr:hypothetical protein [Elusimicrobiota bacterium]